MVNPTKSLLIFENLKKKFLNKLLRKISLRNYWGIKPPLDSNYSLWYDLNPLKNDDFRMCLFSSLQFRRYCPRMKILGKFIFTSKSVKHWGPPFLLVKHCGTPLKIK